MSNNRQLEGLEQCLYFITRFKMSPSEAIEAMARHNQDISFLDVPIRELLKEKE